MPNTVERKGNFHAGRRQPPKKVAFPFQSSFQTAVFSLENDSKQKGQNEAQIGIQKSREEQTKGLYVCSRVLSVMTSA